MRKVASMVFKRRMLLNFWKRMMNFKIWAVLQKKYSILFGFGGQVFNFSSLLKKAGLYYYHVSSVLSICYVIDCSKYINLLFSDLGGLIFNFLIQQLLSTVHHFHYLFPLFQFFPYSSFFLSFFNSSLNLEVLFTLFMYRDNELDKFKWRSTDRDTSSSTEKIADAFNDLGTFYLKLLPLSIRGCCTILKMVKPTVLSSFLWGLGFIKPFFDRVLYYFVMEFNWLIFCPILVFKFSISNIYFVCFERPCCERIN